MADLTIKQLSESEYPLWDLFVASSPQGTVFNTTLWASLLREVFGVYTAVYGVFQEDRLVAGISFSHKRKLGLKVITRLPLTPYNGILFQPPQAEKEQKASSEQQEVLGLILEKLEKEFHFVHFVLHPSIGDLRRFLWRHWYTLPQYTYVNSLADLEHLWKLLSSSLRRKINRAGEMRFSIVQKDDPTLLLKFQEMSYARAGMKPVLSFDMFKRFCEAAARANLLRIYSATDPEGNVHAERAVIHDRDRAYDWIAGTNLQIEDAPAPKSSDLDEPVGNSANGLVEGHANQLLVWEIFKMLSSEGIRTFDFLGANTPSVVEFKRAFGGELVCYFEVRYFSSPFVQTLNFLNQRWRHLQRRT